MHGEGSVDAEDIVKLQECVKYLKSEVGDAKQESSNKDLTIAHLENDMRTIQREKTQLDETVKALNQNVQEL